jgi:hypothetical protein
MFQDSIAAAPEILQIIHNARRKRGCCISDVLTGAELNELNKHLQSKGQYIARWDVVGTSMYRAFWFPIREPVPVQLEFNVTA